MKKYFIRSIAAAFVVGMAVTGCSTSSEEALEQGSDNGPKLKIVTRAGEAEAAYAHKALLVSGVNIADAKSATSAAGLTAFSVEAGTYTVYATAANAEANLTFTGVAKTNPIADARIKITDINGQIPELMVGKSAAVTVGTTSATANIELKRAVASFTVTVKGLEKVSAETIKLTIGNMYDQVDLDGVAQKSGAAFVSKDITLTKDAVTSAFKGNAIVMPTDAAATTLSLAYTVNGTTYTSTPTAKIEPNGQYELTTTVTTNPVAPTLVDLTSVIKYAAWNSAVVNLSDSFTIQETTPTKTWVGPTALPIGGSEAPGYNNFWASTGGNGGGDNFLFDGIKGETSYWYPAPDDQVSPSWFIDLGAAKQGVVIDYWNKFGGKGGGKIKTMDIYGSNKATDYSAGPGATAQEWVKITAFTSDKVTPEVDQGAHLTTGKIPFSVDGTTSYRYVKCTITSRVSPTGTTDTTIDVNVSEVEVATWEFK